MIRYTKEYLIKIIKDYVKKNNNIPSSSRWEKWHKTHHLPSMQAFKSRFGTWGKAIISAGFKPLKSTISKKCRINCIKSRKGKRSGAWKGGRSLTEDGYVLVWCPYIHNYIPEHRLIMSRFLNRPLTRLETVHHKNGIRDDNRIENLELWASNHPAGARIKDSTEWAIKFLEKSGYSVSKNKN